MSRVIYCFYKKSEGSLYAITENKKFYERFISERNKRCFIIKKIKFHHNDEASSFLFTNSSLILGDFPYEDDKSNITMLVATPKEEDILQNKIEEMQDCAVNIKCIFNKYCLKGKYFTALMNLIDISDVDGLKIDILKLFIYLFKDTFYYTDE